MFFALFFTVSSFLTSCQKDSLASLGKNIDNSVKSNTLDSAKSTTTGTSGSSSTPATGTPATTTPATNTPATTTPVPPLPATPGVTVSTPVPPTTTLTYTSSGPITLNGAHDITISGKSITGGSQPCIFLVNCYNIHITKNKIGNSTDVGIKILNGTNILIDYNYITNVSTGVYAANSQSGIRVIYNQFKNMQGPYPRGAFVQFNNVSGTNNRISYNKGENILGASYAEDAINLYSCNGDPNDPIQVVGNWIRGGGPSPHGGGILLGDNGGSYQYAAENILVNPGQYGMGISGGDHMTIVNNQIYSMSQSFSNVGITVWAQAGDNPSIIPITNATVSGNKVNWTSGKYGVNPSYLPGSEQTPKGWSTNIWNANINAGLLPDQIINY